MTIAIQKVELRLVIRHQNSKFDSLFPVRNLNLIGFDQYLSNSRVFAMKKFAARAKKARIRLDPRLDEARALRSTLTPPNQGWIRAIREALGMPTRALAARMGITQGTLSGLEASEMSGAIRLSSLRKAAEAMNCTLVYAFVPRESLEDTVQEQAKKIATEQLSPVEHSMLLENQSVDRKTRQEFLKHYIQNELDLTKIWQ